MQKSLFITSVIFTVLSLSSCNEDVPSPMMWEFSDYDRNAVSAAYTPDYVNQVAIVASPDYCGDITLKCTNYQQLTLNANSADGTFKSEEVGFIVTEVGDNTLKIAFEPIEVKGDNEVYDIVSADGKNSKESGVTNISVGRIKI